jgi:hypothetical protein
VASINLQHPNNKQNTIIPNEVMNGAFIVLGTVFAHVGFRVNKFTTAAMPDYKQ